MSKLQDYLDKIHDPIMAKQSWEDQIIWGFSAYKLIEGIPTRIEPFSDEWNKLVNDGTKD